MHLEDQEIVAEVASFGITAMTEHDLLEVVELEESCGLSRWGWEAYHAELANGGSAVMLVARPRFGIKIADEEKSLSGFLAARLQSGELHINNIAVRDIYRRQGLGRNLLEAALREAGIGGVREAFLEVRESNSSAQRLYQKCGFQIIGRRLKYYSNPQEDALVMKRLIGLQA